METRIDKIIRLLEGIESAIVDGGIDKVLDEHEDRRTNRFLNAQFGFWHTIVAFNGILIGIISVILVIGIGRGYFLALILSIMASTSIFLVLSNFYRSKKAYEKMHYAILELKGINDENARRARGSEVMAAFKKLHDRIIKSEKVTYALVCAELAIILIFVLWSICDKW